MIIDWKDDEGYAAGATAIIAQHLEKAWRIRNLHNHNTDRFIVVADDGATARNVRVADGTDARAA